VSGPGAGEHPTACSMQIAIEYDRQVPAATVSKRLDSFLSDLTNFLRDNGCTLIGHIKGLIDAEESGQLFFSITSFDEPVRYKGEIDGKIGKVELSINVIVYGVEETPIEKAVTKYLSKQFSD
jgi:hypothetical protein